MLPIQRPVLTHPITSLSMRREPSIYAVHSIAMPGRVVSVWRVDGSRLPLHRVDLLDVAHSIFAEGRVYHFHSHRGRESARFAAQLRLTDISYVE